MKTLYWAWLVSLLMTLSATAAPAYRGMSYTPWSENVLFTAGSSQSIANMRAVGVDTVALNVFAFQDDETSTDISLDFNLYSASLPSLAHAIDQIHDRGMQVLLKPNVDLRNGNWRGNILPSAAWFASYTDFMNDWADFAEQHQVEMLSVGTEYNRLQGRESDWRNVIADVRNRYAGQLTYSANHDAYQNIAWWDAVDVIGIDAYFSLASNNDPSLHDLINAWNDRADSIANWRTSRGWTQQVIFAEVGYRSLDGAVQQPWAFSGGGTVDLQEQADAYRALFTVMSQRSWFDGAFWWNWETNPSAGGPQDVGFTPQHKPAEDVLREFYQGSGVPPVRPVLNERVSSWESGLEGWQVSGFNARPVTVAQDPQHATDGSHSLAVTQSGSGFSWNTRLELSTGQKDVLRRMLSGRVEDYVLQFDVIYDNDDLPAGLAEVSHSLAWNNEIGGWAQVDHLAVKNNRSDQTITVAVPLSQFTNLSAASDWFQVVLGFNGSWGTDDLTVYYDDLRWLNVNPAAPADLDGDGDLDVEDWRQFQAGHLVDMSALTLDESFTLGDLDGDLDNDFDDFLLFEVTYDTVHGSGAFRSQILHLPEPSGAIVIFAISAWGTATVRFRRKESQTCEQLGDKPSSWA